MSVSASNRAAYFCLCYHDVVSVNIIYISVFEIMVHALMSIWFTVIECFASV